MNERSPGGSILEAAAPLPGNVAKIRVLLALDGLLRPGEKAAICDIGCVGPTPFNLWEPVFATHDGEFELAGLDIAGLERARSMAESRGWKVDLREGSALSVDAVFEGSRFDVVVSTGVLHALRDWPRAIAATRRVLSPGGRLLLTAPSRDGRIPVKQSVRYAAQRLASHLPGQGARWYRALDREEVLDCATDNGLRAVDWAYCNLRTVKNMYNETGNEGRNELVRRWYSLEAQLRSSAGSDFRPEAFLECFFHLEAV